MFSIAAAFCENRKYKKIMAKTPNTIYVCQNCGNQQKKWQGQCPDCGEWNTFVEEKFRATAQATGKSSAVKNVRFSADAFRDVKPISYSGHRIAGRRADEFGN